MAVLSSAFICRAGTALALSSLAEEPGLGTFVDHVAALGCLYRLRIRFLVFLAAIMRSEDC